MTTLLQYGFLHLRSPPSLGRSRGWVQPGVSPTGSGSSRGWSSWFGSPLQAQRDIYLQRDVPSHVVQSLLAGGGIQAGIFQTTEMVLIGAVGQVLTDQVQRANLLSLVADIRAYRGSEQSVRGRGRLGVVGLVVVILAQVALHFQLGIEVVERLSIPDESVTHLAIPPWCRRHGQVLRIVWLMELHRVDERERIGDVQGFDRMHVDGELSTPKTGIALRYSPIPDPSAGCALPSTRHFPSRI